MAKSRSPRNSPEVRRFLRAGERRIAEAEFLLDHEYTTAAVYLAGYGVECALKALLLSIVPVRLQAETMETFRGTRAHDFVWLQREMTRRHFELPRAVTVPLDRLRWWTTDLRYDPREINEHIARDFLVGARGTLAWVRGTL